MSAVLEKREVEEPLKIVYGKPHEPGIWVAWDRSLGRLCFLVKRCMWRRIEGKWIPVEVYDVASELHRDGLVYRPAGPVEVEVEVEYENEILPILDLEGRVVEEIEVLKPKRVEVIKWKS